MFTGTLYGSTEGAREAEVKCLRERIAELERELIAEKARRREIDDEAYEYAEQVETLRAENEALRAGISSAISELQDAGPKALKYAEQELRAAIDAARAAREGA
jgi:chromosome segregation ATPase